MTQPHAAHASYDAFHRRSIEDRDAFWAEQAQLIEWQTPPAQICDYSNPPFARWFAGGTTNLCHNAVDRHLASRPDQAALIAVSTSAAPSRGAVSRNRTRAVSHEKPAELRGEVRRNGVPRSNWTVPVWMTAEASYALENSTTPRHDKKAS